MNRITVQHIYGMLFWLQSSKAHYELWKQQPLVACQQAIGECQHLTSLQQDDANGLMEAFEDIDRKRIQFLSGHNNDTASIPQDARLYPEGPLFVLVQHALTGQQSQTVGFPDGLKERAQRLTPEQIQQLKDEMSIRREIARRDAILLADWMAMRRRELECQERKLRSFIQNSNGHTAENLEEFEQYINIIRKEFL